ncbi:bifunctional phosphopantothenoylcysteine decarboxylase/phosphopantothenate--cysteine ligase CoaBC [Ponticaulis sp.]|uniref:bifunctional phosphopantothenoylcysteine decarboxylase/phosphopantothenate--cysteine ligase CoaBC n=1 Tax=Ponticaulis sp. TaxID=2020902 RepID=UPI000B75F47E|nr:bifunctional phosphopantothenoylcysteine decarboxylase/phosphopantothenate--cysteine ligase CoaBC [Ponticaulis sp.]MAI91615.1 bifunctional phosphopantothenoylcysteine decarboxylase/phosphopantothenate--cysteine ligase CoaBC [Ponticaulis sp.]OUX97184.1 MAG: bifunctional phosphopantothenoylcysteine decarboxylase/phosphopantothenate synthase [Hyphomonadaceae bacterium TMED5]|tara:strand:+ start:6152 stop:7342 length:1191 start_codon:yes stop_codon:yes gene_type:complete
MSDRSILLIITGGVAAFKSLELIRELGRAGVKSRVILTKAAQEFVTPLSVSALSGEKCFTELFDLNDESEMGHIELSRSTDLVVVCPASADIMGKAANGLANDLASTALLATDKQVLYAPAMNVRMWQHPAVQRNVETLRADGAIVLEPDEGVMACGEFGPGRLPEVSRLKEEILFALAPDKSLAGKHIVITAGPTREPIDPVRYISNHSSGRQGYAIAASLRAKGADVTLISGPVSIAPPDGVELVKVETAREMLAASEAALPANAFISVAAVADWRPASESDTKLKLKGGEEPVTMAFAENPDILKAISNHASQRPDLVIGFAAETHELHKHAQGKLARKGCDWIIANDVSGDVMGGENNEVTLFSKSGAEASPRMTKSRIADWIAERIAKALS